MHPGGNIVSHLKCSEYPIEISLDGLFDLSSFLGGARVRLADRARYLSQDLSDQSFPNVSDWVVVQWHYGRDGSGEVSGPSFNVTFKSWFKELCRIYMHRHGQLLKPRLEVIEQPRKTLVQAFAEKMNPSIVVEG